VSYGFRPGRSAKDALREVDWMLKQGRTWVVDADLASYFDTIPHERLMEQVREHIADGRALDLIEQYLRAEIAEGLDRWTPLVGSPQGAVLSPLLANIYLHGLDREMSAHGYHYVRYADDFVVLCESGQEARAALEHVRRWVETAKLRLSAEKTHIADSREKGQGFDFLGYRFERGRRWVRDKSRTSLKDRIRRMTRRSRGDSLDDIIILDLNPMLKGWFVYFKHAAKWEFAALDKFIRRRLRALLRRQLKLDGRHGRSLLDHQRWPNAFFADHRLFSLTTAHALASRSR
jgi:RNA-directed DNA polymerase